MAASASINPGTSQMAVIAAGNPARSNEVSVRETAAFLRDIIIVMGLQLVFRTMLLLRKLNY
jgi:hypothetical protein